jgi:hypothetical protein
MAAQAPQSPPAPAAAIHGGIFAARKPPSNRLIVAQTAKSRAEIDRRRGLTGVEDRGKAINHVSLGVSPRAGAGG